MEWLINNWYYIVFVVVLAVIGVYGCAAGKAKEWLKWAVFVAEKELKSGTGQAKLRMVYDMFIEKFPALSSVLPFFIFSKWVDLALDWLRDQLGKNDNIKQIVEG